MEDKRLDDYSASYSFDRPPPYEYNFDASAPPGPSNLTYNSLIDEPDPMKSSNLIQPTTMVTQPKPLSINNVQIHRSDKFGPYPQAAFCPHCNQNVITRTKPVSGALTWLACLGLLLIGCLVCCLFPFCCNSCRNVDHTCPLCDRKIGHYMRSC